jgi:hypothetical protein
VNMARFLLKACVLIELYSDSESITHNNVDCRTSGSRDRSGHVHRPCTTHKYSSLSMPKVRLIAGQGNAYQVQTAGQSANSAAFQARHSLASASAEKGCIRRVSGQLADLELAKKHGVLHCLSSSIPFTV